MMLVTSSSVTGISLCLDAMSSTPASLDTYIRDYDTAHFLLNVEVDLDEDIFDIDDFCDYTQGFQAYSDYSVPCTSNDYYGLSVLPPQEIAYTPSLYRPLSASLCLDYDNPYYVKSIKRNLVSP